MLHFQDFIYFIRIKIIEPCIPFMHVLSYLILCKHELTIGNNFTWKKGAMDTLLHHMRDTNLVNVLALH